MALPAKPAFLQALQTMTPLLVSSNASNTVQSTLAADVMDTTLPNTPSTQRTFKRNDWPAGDKSERLFHAFLSLVSCLCCSYQNAVTLEIIERSINAGDTYLN